MFATSLFYALYGKENDYIAQHFTDQLSKKEYKDFFSDNKYALIGRAKEKDGAMLHNLGGYIVDAFAIAFWGLLNFENFKDGMMAVIRLGGDTDTNAAIYGQLAGAYYGYEAIPEEWREGVYLASELVEIADELLELKSCPVIRTRFEDERCFQENKA
jgi:ADP-ribosylglycohydrolase